MARVGNDARCQVRSDGRARAVRDLRPAMPLLLLDLDNTLVDRDAT